MRVAMRVLGSGVLVVVLAALVASGMTHGWTSLHVGFVVALGVLAVVVAWPAKKAAPVMAGARVGRGR